MLRAARLRRSSLAPRRAAGLLLLAASSGLAAASLEAVPRPPSEPAESGATPAPGGAVDLGVSLRDPGGAVHLQGSTFTVGATVSSPSDVGAGVARPVVRLVLPPALAFRSASGAGWSCSGAQAPGGDSLRCAASTLAAGATQSFALVVEARGSSPFVSVHATVTDAARPGVSSGSSAALLVLLAGAATSVATSDTPDPAPFAASTAAAGGADPMPPLAGLLCALALALAGAPLLARRPAGDGDARAARRPPPTPR